MKFLNADIDFDDFFHRLGRSKSRILMLDYDGTLAPFRVKRDEAVPYPGVCELLDTIKKSCGTRLVIISGRAIEDLIPLMGMRELPEIWGSHGWERMEDDGTVTRPELPAGARDGLQEAAGWIEQQGMAGRMEIKPASVAIHWRGLGDEEIADVREKTYAGWRTIASRSGLRLAEFDGGIEIRTPGRDKGDAVKALLAESGGETAAAYLGDDLTDEDAFEALKGRGLCAFVNADLRETAADVWLKPPEELIEFLRRWAKATGGTDEG